ncbi:hypothetical protein [Priestia megaterium]|uniref:hypothetical protein n=1 Tax=Priestia megaterium TaxID=1404 RepID=UPI0015D4B3B9|nr:hypothetical protein [Priestia megaterium]
MNDWYGLNIGDSVRYNNISGVITSLSILDNNSGTMMTSTGKIIPVTCDNCKKQ